MRHVLIRLKSSLSVLLCGVFLGSALGLADTNQANNKNYVFNLTGSMRGYGDVAGPLFAIIGFKKERRDVNVTVVVDERAEAIIKDIYLEDLHEVGEDLGIRFVLSNYAQEIPKSDISFELFFGGRFIHDFVNVVFNTEETAVVISDTMHGLTLDEVRHPDFHFYFKPPGIGAERSGIIENPEIDKFSRKPQDAQIRTAAHFFENKTLKDLLFKTGWRKKILFGFVYGVHNEIFKPELIGQTELYARELAKTHPKNPVVLFTPNTGAELVAAGIASQHILEQTDLESLTDLGHGVYFLSLPGLSNAQFVALLAMADVPVLVEGNSSLSAAVKLEKEFLLMRSAWNAPQINDLREIDVTAKTFLYSDVYQPNENVIPLFPHYFSKGAARRMFSKYSLAAQVGDFSSKLVAISRLIDQLKQQSNIDYIKLIREVARATHDEYLEYSLIQDLTKRKKISAGELYKVRKRFKSRGISIAAIESRLRPNRPNFSKKIEELDAAGDLAFENLCRTASPINFALPSAPLREPICSREKVPGEFEALACSTHLEKLSTNGDFSKVVWTFWDKGSNAMPAFNKYNVQQWRRLLGDEWSVVVVSSERNDPCYFQNIHFGVDTEDLPKNFRYLEDSISTFDRTSAAIIQSDFIRLALLKKYGGVWMDSSIVLLNHLDALPWVNMLARDDKEIGGYVNEGQSTDRNNGVDGFENWFIAAKRGSKVISAWLDAFKQYWESKVKGQDIVDHPMFKNKVSLAHLPPDLKNYLSQHAALSYMLSQNPELSKRFIMRPASGPFAYASLVGWDPVDIYEMFVNPTHFSEYVGILVNEENADFLKFPSSNLKVVKAQLHDVGMYYRCDNIISQLYSLQF